MREVVVTGVGAITPLGVGASTLVDRWTAGECGLADGVGQCAEFDPSELMTQREVWRSDRYTQLAIAAVHGALTQAGWLDGLPFAPERVGVVWGTGIGGLSTLEQQYERFFTRGPKRVSPLGVPLFMSNAAPASIAMRYGIHGYTSTTVTACAAGADAVASAAQLVRAGELDAAVAGGSEAALTPFAQAAFRSMGATSPTGESRPFDARRDGFVLGEGAGVLVLEEADAARRRGSRPLARLRGVGRSSDAHHLTAPEPDGDSAAVAMQRALADADLRPGDVDYVNAHGTSTPLNDRSETVALKAVFGDRAARLPISSTKSAVGHLLGAAGAVEAAATIVSLERGVAPPTLGYGVPDPELDLDYVVDGPRPLERDGHALIGMSNSFGFGGHNVVLVLEQGEAA